MELDGMNFKLNKVQNIKHKILNLANQTTLDHIERLMEPSTIDDQNSNLEINSLKHEASYSNEPINEFKNNYIISCCRSSRNVITIWDMHNGKAVKSFKDPIDTIDSMHVLSNDRLLTVTKDFKLKLWDLKLGRFIRVMSDHKGPANCVLSMPNDSILVGGLSALEILDFENRTFKGVNAHRGHINCLVKFSDDYFISGANDHFIKVWDYNLGKRVRIFTGVGPVTSIVVAKNLNFS
jgi:WD40 repeat protein